MPTASSLSINGKHFASNDRGMEQKNGLLDPQTRQSLGFLYDAYAGNIFLFFFVCLFLPWAIHTCMIVPPGDRSTIFVTFLCVLLLMTDEMWWYPIRHP